jgi:hypothetical protein
MALWPHPSTADAPDPADRLPAGTRGCSCHAGGGPVDRDRGFARAHDARGEDRPDPRAGRPGCHRPSRPVDYLQAIRTRGVGTVSSLWGPVQTREVERIGLEETRLGIRPLFVMDVIHGVRTVSPLLLAEASALDPAQWRPAARRRQSTRSEPRSTCIEPAGSAQRNSVSRGLGRARPQRRLPPRLPRRVPGEGAAGGERCPPTGDGSAGCGSRSHCARDCGRC